VTQAPDSGDALWRSVERLLERADVDGIRTHKLGALAAWHRRRRGEPVHPSLAVDERGAAVARLIAPKLLELVRAGCDGPLMLLKGPELARLYPGHARLFVDLDVLVPDAPAVQRALLRAGFVAVGKFYEDAQHLRPLKWPALSLNIEVHKRPSWPKRLAPPRVDEILEAAQSSGCGVDGIVAPLPAHHALMLAAHAWKENPLGTMRDLVDIAAVSADTPETELERMASSWGLRRIWSATRETTEALLGGHPLPRPIRIWARHLETVRERTVLEHLLREWLQAFSKQPPRLALAETRDIMRRQLSLGPGQDWVTKVKSISRAFRHRQRSISAHGARD
jgi:hypothetical protein